MGVDPKLSEVNRQNRRFRIAVSVFMVATVIGLVAIAWLVYAGVQAQFKHLNDLNQQRRNETQQQIDQLSDYVKCVAAIFAQSQQGIVTVEDLDQCKLHPGVPAAGVSGLNIPYHTDPVTGEPTQPNDPSTQSVSPQPAAAPTQEPLPANPQLDPVQGFVKSIRDTIKSITGI